MQLQMQEIINFSVFCVILVCFCPKSCFFGVPLDKIPFLWYNKYVK